MDTCVDLVVHHVSFHTILHVCMRLRPTCRRLGTGEKKETLIFGTFLLWLVYPNLPIAWAQARARTTISNGSCKEAKVVGSQQCCHCALRLSCASTDDSHYHDHDSDEDDKYHLDEDDDDNNKEGDVSDGWMMMMMVMMVMTIMLHCELRSLPQCGLSILLEWIAFSHQLFAAPHADDPRP